MSCPADFAGTAIKRCPFLNHLAADRGEGYARSFALKPTHTVGHEPLFPEAVADYRFSFRLFHGPQGVVPLVRMQKTAEAVEIKPSDSHTAQPEGPIAATSAADSAELASGVAALPFASINANAFRFIPGPGDFLARRRRKRQERKEQRADQKAKSEKARQNNSKHRRFRLSNLQSHPILGGLIPLNAAGRYVCPPLVIAGRQAVAKMKSVRLLKPHALPIKLLGVSVHCLLANIPCGMAREHTEKFSVAWFIVVHSTVPFFAFMRKGVGMPKWAIALTLASAITGQAIGAKLEKLRMEKAAEARQLKASTAQLKRFGRGYPLVRTCEEMAQPGNPLACTCLPLEYKPQSVRAA